MPRFFRYVFILAMGLSLSFLSNTFALSSPSSLKLSSQKSFSLFSSHIKNSPMPLHDATVGSLAGKLEVTPTGSASYNIPIDVPPGTAGMVPQISLQYDSQQGNGLLGMGFSLAGLTAMTRTGSNMAQNGKIRGVHFDDQDHFVLDGEQLVAIHGDYGKDQTEYRTYDDTQAKIISHGQQGNGPASFKVWTKGGQMAEYGVTDDSQIKAQGKDTVAVWALNKIADRNGNYLTVHYFKDETSGEYYPDEIDYTGNDAAKVSPYNKIQFIYSDRQDYSTHWQSGSKMTLSKLLTEIKVYSDQTTLVYDYKLTYELSPSTLRSRLVSVQKCAGDGTCLPATKFHWQDKGKGWSQIQTNLPAATAWYNGDVVRPYSQLVDLAGTGIPMEVQSYEVKPDGTWNSIWKQQADGSWIKEDSYQLPEPLTVFRLITPDYDDKYFDGTFIDLNGDGLLDYATALYLNDPWQLTFYTNTGEGFEKSTYPIVNMPAQDYDHTFHDFRQSFVDLNGDGRVDLVSSMMEGTGAQVKKAWMNTGKEFVSADQYALPVPYFGAKPGSGNAPEQDGFFANVAGDGLPDYIYTDAFSRSGRVGEVYLNPFSHAGKWEKANYEFPYPQEPVLSAYPDTVAASLVDLNGDGLTDHVYSYIDSDGKEYEYAWINTGNGWIADDNYKLPKLMYYTDSKNRLYRRGYFVDINHSGLPAYIYAYYGSPTDHAEEVYLNTGHGWQKADFNLPMDAAQTPQYKMDYSDRFVDLNGNGLPDYVYHFDEHFINVSTSEQATYLNNGPVPDLLDQVTDGLGEKTHLNYAPLTQSNVYTKEHDAEYPNMDLQTPMVVVYQTMSDHASNYAPTENNNDGQHITTYHYTGAKYNHLGFGFLGFHQVTSTDETTGISKTSTYEQDPSLHYLGQKISTETHLKDGTLIHSLQNEWDVKTFGSGKLNETYYLAYLKQSTEKAYALRGQLMDTTTISTEVDDFANPTKMVNEVDDTQGNHYITTTTNNYQNNTDLWFIGQLESASVKHEAPNTAAITKTSSFEYDAQTGLLMKTMAEPDKASETLTTTYQRDGFGHIVSTTVSGQGIEPRTNQVNYDAQGRFVIEQTNALNQTITEVMDPRFGVPLQTTDLNGLITTDQYDSFGRLVKQINPDHTATQTSLSWYQPQYNNHLNDRTLGIGNNEVMTDAIYSKSTQAVDANGKSIGVLNITYYDELNRPVATSSQSLHGETIWQTTQYDNLDRPVVQSTPYFGGDDQYTILRTYTRFEYDVLGRVVKTFRPDGSIIQVNYDGFKTTTINPLNQQATKISDPRDKLIQSIDHQGHVTNYQYDANGDLTAMIDSQGNVSTLTYDRLGRKTAMNDPDKGHWTYQYDVLGELISQTDAKNQTTTMVYDKLGRLISRTDLAGTSTWTYGNDVAQHNVGQLIQVNGVANHKGGPANATDLIRAEKDGLVNYSQTIQYDELARPNQIDTEINGQHYIQSTQYDENSRPEILTDPDGFKTQNIYNDLGFLVQMINPDNHHVYWQLNQLDAKGNITSETHGNGLVTTRTYDIATGFLTDIETSATPALRIQQHFIPFADKTKKEKQKNNLNAIQSLHYQYDALGEVTQRKDSVNNLTENFQYDTLNRITQWTSSVIPLSSSAVIPAQAGIQSNKIGQTNNTTQTYQYDNLGNLTYKSDMGHYVYDKTNAGPHAVTSITDDQGKTLDTFKYDANGDQIEGTINGEHRVIDYTSFNVPKQMMTDKAQVNFFYNADRNRFERVDKVGDTTTTTLYLGDYELVQHQQGTEITTEQKHYIGNDALYTTDSDGKSYTYELLKDNLGSVTAITDENGNVIERYHYTPFGEQETISSAVIPAKAGIQSNKTGRNNSTFPITHHGFTNQEEIESMNLIHMNGRLYDPRLGRFLSADPYIQDPSNSQSLNRYSYCLNNPLAYTDPTGYSWFGDLIHDIGHALDQVITDKVAGVILKISICVLAAVSQQYWALYYGMAAGYMGYANKAETGSWKDSFKIAAITFASMCVWKGVGGELEKNGFGEETANFSTEKGLESVLVRTAVHAGVGGGLNVAEGGSFQDGALAAAAGEVLSGPIESINVGNEVATVAARGVAAGIVGGTIASATGGDFENGAWTAAYAEMFNDFLHDMQQKYMQDKYEKQYAAWQKEVWNQNNQMKSALSVDFRNYVIEHGSFSADLSIPVMAGININLGVDASSQGWSFHFGGGPAIGGAFDFSTGVNLSYGRDASGFSERVYAEKGFLGMAGAGISGYHSSAGYGVNVNTGYIRGTVVGGEIGYTSRRYNW